MSSSNRLQNQLNRKKKDSDEEDSDFSDSDNETKQPTTKSIPSKPIGRSSYDSTPVPIGGKRVPAAMQSQADWMSLPERQPTAKQSYGPEYDQLEQQRLNVEKIKKAISAATLHLAVVQRHSAAVEASTDEEKTGKLRSAVEKEKDKLSSSIKEIRSLTASLNTSQESKELASNIEEVATRLSSELSIDQFNKLNEDARYLGQSLFRFSTKLLQQLKAAKQQASKNKEECKE